MVLAAGTSLLLSGCGGVVDPLSPSPSDSARAGGTVVVVGSAASTESGVVAQIYAQALAAKGVTVSTKANIGSREMYLKALTDGSISLVPEYTGSLLRHFDLDATATTAAEVDQALPQALPPDLTVGKPARAVDQDTYVVTGKFSQQHGVTSLADLKKLAGTIVLGGPPELKTRAYGPQGLEQIYGATLKQFKPYDSSAVRSRALNDGKIDVAEFFSTEAVIRDNGYVVLDDPQAMILPQHVVPLMRSDVAGNPTVTSTLDSVQSALTTEDLAALNKSVDVDQTDADRVAGAWLRSKGLA